MKKKILVIGNDANAYALIKKLSKEHEIFVTPSSDALKEIATVIDIREDNVTELLEFVLENGIDLTIPVSMAAIKSNIAEIFNQNGQQIFGPSRKASQIIFDKALAKKTLYKLKIRTPKFGIFDKQNNAMDYIKNQKIPFVIKTNDSNSATIFTSQSEVKKYTDYATIDKNNILIIEDYIYGTPFAFYALTDGYKALPIGSSILYKHKNNGNGGQLTSGMGACSPNYKISHNLEDEIMANIIEPTVNYLESQGAPYTGILGINGIITDEGEIYTLGWNSFFQNADTTANLNSIDCDFIDLIEKCCIGSFSDEVEYIPLNNKYSVSLVLTCKNKNNNENTIKGINITDEDIVKIDFFPNIKRNKYLEYEACSDSNLVITASAATIACAAHNVYETAETIDFIGKYNRTDICL